MKHPNDDGSGGADLLVVAITFGLTVTAGVLLGFWLDGRLTTTPLFTVVGTLLATGVAGFWAYRRIGGGGRGNAPRR